LVCQPEFRIRATVRDGVSELSQATSSYRNEQRGNGLDARGKIGHTRANQIRARQMIDVDHLSAL
jgi:hypothetical protein